MLTLQANGLSVTDLATPLLLKRDFNSGDVIEVSVDVTNTGKVAGKESVLLFSSDLWATLTPDVRRLRDYTKVSLQPGETKTVTFHLKADDLAYVDNSLNWVLEPGEFRLACGSENVIVNCVRGK